MTSTGTLGVTYAEAATVGTVAEIKKQPLSDVTPSITDNVKHIPANDVPVKIATDDVAELSTKKSVEGSGDGKAVKSQPANKPGKASDSIKAAGDSSVKAADREVFVPAPPPTTNAWAKRLQNQGPTTRPNAVVAPLASTIAPDNKQPERKVEPAVAITTAVVSDAPPKPETSGAGKPHGSSGTVRQSAEDESPSAKSPVSCSSYASAAAGDDGKPKSEVLQLPNASDSKVKQDSNKKTTNAVVEAPRVLSGKTVACSGKNVDNLKSSVKKDEESCENVSQASLEQEVPVSEKHAPASGG